MVPSQRLALLLRAHTSEHSKQAPRVASTERQVPAVAVQGMLKAAAGAATVQGLFLRKTPLH